MSKEHTRNVFAWLTQINRDKSLPPAGLKVALAIAQRINKDSGECYPSTKVIAGDCALAQSSIIKLVSDLAQAGHLEIEFGMPGRGHSNRYRMFVKPPVQDVLNGAKHPVADVLEPTSGGRKTSGPANKTSAPASENIRASEIKHPVEDMNHLREPLKRTTSITNSVSLRSTGAPPARRAVVTKIGVTVAKPSLFTIDQIIAFHVKDKNAPRFIVEKVVREWIDEGKITLADPELGLYDPGEKMHGHVPPAARDYDRIEMPPMTLPSFSVSVSSSW